jgi:AraC-like DNA-binding protein
MIRDNQSSEPARTLPARRLGGPAASARVHLTALRGLSDALDECGLSGDAVLEGAGFRPADFGDYDRTNTFAEIDDLLEDCIRQTNCPHLGLLIARRLDLQSLGITGRLALNADRVGAALQDLVAYFALHDNGGAPSLAIHDGTVLLGYGIHTPGIRHADLVYDLAAVGLCNIMRQLCGSQWKPDLILLPRRRPADLNPYREMLGTPIRFDAVQCAVLFGETWLNRSIADTDPMLHELLKERAIAALDDAQPLLESEVRRAIRLLLLEGQHSRAAVAARLGMHERTLGRRLKEAGTTFQALLDEARADVAKHLLHDTRTSVARISSSLGYRDPTVFTRAFRRWTGMTPRRYRAGLAGRRD